MVGSRVVRLSCAVLLACAILVLGAGRADAEEVPGSWYGPGYYGPTTSGGSYDASNHTPSRELLPSGTEPELRYGGSPGPEADGRAGHPIGVAEQVLRTPPKTAALRHQILLGARPTERCSIIRTGCLKTEGPKRRCLKMCCLKIGCLKTGCLKRRCLRRT